MDIARYENRDRDGLASMVLAIQTQEFGLPATFEGQPDLVDPPGFFRKGAGEFWVARDPDGAVVGSIGLVEFLPGQGAVRKMFVRADRRGRELGLAQTLLETLIAHAKREGIRSLSLGTTEFFKAAHRFYERNGFAEIASADLPPEFPRMSVDTKLYRRAL
jgi:GNAT superfamily N-acetyltransferase